MRLRAKKIDNDSLVAERPSTGALPPAHPVDGAVVLGVGTRSEILTVIRNFARSVEVPANGEGGRRADRGRVRNRSGSPALTEGFRSDRWYADETRHGLTSYVGFDASWMDGPEAPGGTTLLGNDREGR